jgi:energy-coupling factor transporter ATP-binding protein EcfA2
MPEESATGVIERRAERLAVPAAPRTPEETGVPFLFLVELLTKILFLRGQMQLAELVNQVKLSVSVVERLLNFLRTEKLCEITRRGNTGTDADLCYLLTDQGRARGGQYVLHNAYAGPAPVTLEAYTAQVKAQSVAGMHTTRADIEAEFADLVVNPKVLEQLGAAMNSGRAIFVYGPAGSGKTYLAERLRGLLSGTVLVPHAIMVDREVLPFYDNLVHELAPEAQAAPPNFDRRAMPDERWVRIKRPAVLVGGELTLPMLDVEFDPGTRLYHAPAHMKANNGIFIIDDLGRQRCSAVELMNRWIVPMDRRIDFLALHTGYKFPVPFDVIIVFSSNFAPEQLADGAFLRRLGYKIHVAEVTAAQYEKIFRTVCEDYGIAFDQESFDYLLREHHYKEQRALLACYPRDILAQVRDVARYHQRPPALNPGGLAWAWNNYFTTHGPASPASHSAPVANGLFYERRNRSTPEGS